MIKYHNVLYHFTTEQNLNSILESNTLLSYGLIDPISLRNYSLKPYISFTRNKNFIWREIRISLDRDLLKNNYKIIPFDHFGKFKIQAKVLYQHTKFDIDQI